MNEDILNKYKKAGEILKKAESEAKKLVKPGAKILDIANSVEGLIQQEGGKPAFPTNVSINDIGAHYTPDSDTILEIGENDLVKIDIGVHVDGYIADRAITFSMDKSEEQLKLIEAAESGLKAAIDIIKPGLEISEIGKVIEEKIKSFGFKSISNLTGHGLDEYSLHAGLTIPNVENDSKTKLEEGQAIALEPFATNGEGYVIDTNETHIYEFLMQRPSRIQESRRILQMAEHDFGKLPFAKRWLGEKIGRLKLALALRDLVNSKALYSYPVLREKAGGLVAQAEHTVIVQEEPIVTTL